MRSFSTTPDQHCYCFYISGVHRWLSTRFEIHYLDGPDRSNSRRPSEIPYQPPPPPPPISLSLSLSLSLLTPSFTIDEANPTSVEKPRPSRLHNTNPLRRPSLPSPRICRGSQGWRHDRSAAAFRVIPESPLKPSIMSSAPAAVRSQSPALKALFKTPEGRYKLLHEKTLPPAAASHGKSVSQLTIAYLKEKPPANTSQAAPSATSSGVRSAAARLLGSGNGSRSLSNGVTRVVSANSRTGGPVGASVGSSAQLASPNYDGKGTYLIFSTADTLFISDLNSMEKDPIKSIQFGNSNPVCHAFDAEASDGHDLLIGLHSGDIYLVSLRQQLQDPGRKLLAAQHYNKEGTTNNSRCTCVAWVPEREGTFVVGHADGNIYVYEKSNPVARWHVCHGSVNSISFSVNGTYMATVTRDGYLRVFDFSKEQLAFGGKSYYGALLCSAWSLDGKYILTGGEDDLVQVWSMEDKKIVAWGEGHNSWVSGVAFDSYWSTPNSEGTEENVVYRFGSVGQDGQLLLWDLVMDELIMPLRCPPGGSATLSSGSHSASWDSMCPMSALLPAPSMRDMPKISPLVAHSVHMDPLSGLIFTNESVITISRDGHIKIWERPQNHECSQSGCSHSVVAAAPIAKHRPVDGIHIH
ncbi:probable catabolite repression protein creC isoform X4 [Musa acuminata AAA Group]|uniref:probable catabolite repression protein creC isoform X4 n=1 Tax=Musa acuminata AAA Group TaxID=214697 RepID=UPI0031D070EE